MHRLVGLQTLDGTTQSRASKNDSVEQVRASICHRPRRAGASTHSRTRDGACHRSRLSPHDLLEVRLRKKGVVLRKGFRRTVPFGCALVSPKIGSSVVFTPLGYAPSDEQPESPRRPLQMGQAMSSISGSVRELWNRLGESTRSQLPPSPSHGSPTDQPWPLRQCRMPQELPHAGEVVAWHGLETG